MLAPVLIVGCAPKPSEQNIYKHDDLGVQIVIPDNWSPISSADAGQADIVWEEGEIPPTDELSLGYFDPNTKEKVGIFIFTIWEKVESDEDITAFEEGMSDFDKIIWNNSPCYYREIETENSVTRSYTIIHKKTVLAFLIGIEHSHENLGTNIINEITF